MKKNNRKLFSVKFFLAPFLLALGACDANGMCCDNVESYNYYPKSADEEIGDTNSYLDIKENRFTKASENNKSTFSMCSSTEAYTNIKNLINNGSLPNKNSVIIEQMLNYFSYSYQLNENENLGILNEVSDCPWNSSHKLASIAVKAKEVESISGNLNFVFLIDVSGSMSEELGNVKECFETLTKKLGDNDRVSIVTYANGVNTVLDGASAKDKDLITTKVNSLTASGGTNGSGGIQKAYEIAQKHFINGGNNRVILATDGDFNVGISNQGELEDFISSKRNTGIYLTILGFGMGNYHSSTAQTLARSGNGNVFYVNDRNEARKIFTNGIASVFEVVAKDTKTQIVFDVEQVNTYRLLGYENAMLTDEQFQDEKVDAGEVLSGDVTVAMYEIELTENADLTKSLFTSDIHYKDPKTNEDKFVKNDNAIHNSNYSADFTFQSMVVEYALVLRESKYKGDASLDHVIRMYNENSSNYTNDEDKVGFYTLLTKTKELKQRENNQY